MDRSALLCAIERVFDAKSYTQIPGEDIKAYGSIPVYAKAYNCRKAAQTFEETIDNVREALGLAETHYLVIANDVEDVVKERDKLQAELAKIKNKSV